MAVAAGRAVKRVWENELGGQTYEIGTGSGRCFVKWTPTASGVDLGREVARLAWAVDYTPVPVVLDKGVDDEGSWIISAALPGESAVGDRWKAQPATAVSAIGEGLRAMHDALPVEACPFSWSVEERLADIDRLLVAGRLDPASWDPLHRALGVERARRLLSRPPDVDRHVVCHGDACSPNTLLSDDGRWSAHVDLGALGVADRWADLAVATWSVGWNYGPGWEGRLLDAYGIAPDPGRSRYYRLLWDLGP